MDGYRPERPLSGTERQRLRLLVDARQRQLLVAARGGTMHSALSTGRRGPRIVLSEIDVPLRPDAIEQAVRVPYAA